MGRGFSPDLGLALRRVLTPEGGQGRPFQFDFPGGHTAGATPVPIPNTVVKPRRADVTAWFPGGKVGRRRVKNQKPRPCGGAFDFRFGTSSFQKVRVYPERSRGTGLKNTKPTLVGGLSYFWLWLVLSLSKCTPAFLVGDRAVRRGSPALRDRLSCLPAIALAKAGAQPRGRV